MIIHPGIYHYETEGLDLHVDTKLTPDDLETLVAVIRKAGRCPSCTVAVDLAQRKVIEGLKRDKYCNHNSAPSTETPA